MKRKAYLGFTLIELLIVVAIIAVLAAIAVPNFLQAQTRSKVSRTMSDMRTIAVAIEAYRSDNNSVPITGLYVTKGQERNFLKYIRLDNGQEAGAGYLLTTPITYLSSIPIGVFNTMTFKKQMPHHIAIPGGVGGFASVYYLAGVGNFYIGAEWAKVYGVRHFQFWLSSSGPDLTPWGFNNNNEFFYNPTNGTISHGDINYIAGTGGFFR